jgi:hypothetical protein
MKKNLPLLIAFAISFSGIKAQNISGAENVMVVGNFNGYNTTPFGTDYRTTNYRKLSFTTGTPTDGRGQWATTINVQNSGGDVSPINMPGGSSSGFLFISGPSFNRFQNKWVFSNIGQGALDVVNNNTAYNSGEDMGLNMNNPGYYTFAFNDCGYTLTDAKFYVGYTSATPVTIPTTTFIVNPNNTATVTITTNAALSPQEKLYIRYTTGANFAATGTSVVVQASGSGTSYTATIPAFPEGSFVLFYSFSSTRTLSEFTTMPEIEKSLSVLNYNDNTNANYAYTLGPLSSNLYNFRASAISNKIFLNWKVDNDSDNDYYQILKSNDGQNFDLLTQLDSRNSLDIENYQTVDAQPNSGANYYKLIIVKPDGSKKMSSIIKINGNKETQNLIVYLYAGNTKINVRTTQIPKGNYTLNIVNSLGQIVSQKQIFINNSFAEISLDIFQSLQKGVYRAVLINKTNTHKAGFMAL